MEPALLAHIERLGSSSRLARYKAATNSEIEAVTLYFWNVQLAEALFPAIATLEVALRNAVHDVLTYWEDNDMWFSHVLHFNGQQKFSSLLGELTRKLGAAPTPGKIVSELSFGFWTSLFTHYYHSLWWDPPTNPPLVWVLPHHPNVARDTRGKFSERLEYFLVLRNRVMHHEAIYEGVSAHNKVRLDLPTLHAQIVETIGWINQDASTAFHCMDRFAKVYDPAWKATLQVNIKREFGIP